MAYRKTYEGLSAIRNKSIVLPIDSLLNPNDLNRYLEIFTRNTDLNRIPNRKSRLLYDTDKDHIIQVIIWMNFELEFRNRYSNNYVELCPRFDEETQGPGSMGLKIDVLARFGPGDSIDEFENYLNEFYHIDKISKGG